MQTFGLTVTVSTAADAWPLVTIPYFDTLAQNYRNQSHVGVVGFAPLVENPAEWERYVYGQQLGGQTITPYIFKTQSGVRVQEFGLTEGYVAPLWQVYPMATDTNFINYNLFRTPWIQELLLASKDDQQAKVSDVLNSDDILAIFPLAYPASSTDAWSLLAQPIFRTVDENEVAGYLLSLFPWGATLFDNSLGWNDDNQQESVLCVLRGEDGEAYTYRVHGSKVEFLGSGDSAVDSDAHGDDPVQARSTMVGQRRLQTDESNHPIPIFTVEVYPTKEFHDSYTSNKPGLYTFLVILILGSVAFWFAVCQRCQEQENRTNDRIKHALGGVDWTCASGGGPRQSASNNGLRGNNKQLMNAFLSDQKQGTQDVSGEIVSNEFDSPPDHNTNIDQSHRSTKIDQSHHSRDIDQSHRSRSNDNNQHGRNMQKYQLPLTIQDSKPIADLFPSGELITCCCTTYRNATLYVPRGSYADAFACSILQQVFQWQTSADLQLGLVSESPPPRSRSWKPSTMVSLLAIL